MSLVRSKDKTLACKAVLEALPGVVDGPLEDWVAAHTASCLRCQAEIAQYRRVARSLRTFEAQLALVPLGLHAGVMRALADAQGKAAFLWKGVAIGAGALVAAAGTTAGILLTRRHRFANRAA
jgi:hypothetical protein